MVFFYPYTKFGCLTALQLLYSHHLGCRHRHGILHGNKPFSCANREVSYFAPSRCNPLFRCRLHVKTGKVISRVLFKAVKKSCTQLMQSNFPNQTSCAAWKPFPCAKWEAHILHPAGFLYLSDTNLHPLFKEPYKANPLRRCRPFNTSTLSVAVVVIKLRPNWLCRKSRK